MIVSLWITIGLIISASLVSSLGAYFSILGLGALFSGASVAIWLMAGSLELSKFVLAAYLHQTWKNINTLFKVYLTSAIIILSFITSIGVFGFLSDAYQSASTVLDVEAVKMKDLTKKKETAQNEIDRLNYLVEEVPETRVSKKIQVRAEMEPKIAALQKQMAEYDQQMTQADLNLIEVKKKVGPLLYIAKTLNVEIDSIVKYLIFLFVIVFDPLAICMVIAATYSLETRRRFAELKANDQVTHDFVALNKHLKIKETNQNETVAKKNVPPLEIITPLTESVEAFKKLHTHSDENKNQDNSVVVKMNFKTELDPEIQKQVNSQEKQSQSSEAEFVNSKENDENQLGFNFSEQPQSEEKKAS